MKRYNPKDIEQKWQQSWAEDKIYEASDDTSKPKRYILEYFPYPSGAAMHVGHVRNYTIGDVMSRHARMNGYDVLHPMGWDAFGLPAENYAIKTGVSPQEAIAENTGKFKDQLIKMGFSYDWSREFWSSDPDYYRWTQWFFLLLHKRGLAYRQESLQWWCPVDKTVLANEQVEAGHCWRCGSVVEKKALKQWFFKITDYADRLSKDLDDVDWSESIKSMQRNWIGKSTGAEVEFQVASSSEQLQTEAIKDSLKFRPELAKLVQAGTKTVTIRHEPKNVALGDYVKLQTRYNADEVKTFAVAKITHIETKQLKNIANDHPGHNGYASDEEKLAIERKQYGPGITLESEFTIYTFEKVWDVITVFTTRPDTLYGATFMVLAPEHPLLESIVPAEHLQQVEHYRQKAQNKTDVERQETNREKTGVFTGAYAINPVSGAKLPIWTADYVLMGYGTGAIMAVPAHDERDNEFAKVFNLPITQVVAERFSHAGNEFQADAPTVPRQVVCAVVKHPTEDKYLIAKPNGSEFWSPVMGGIDEGETAVEAAKRELLEEAGYSDIAEATLCGETIASEFYAQHKQVNRIAYVQTVLIRLASLDATEVSKEEQATQELKWATKAEVDKLCVGAGAKEIYAFAAGVTRPIVTEGRLINSGEFSGLPTSEARDAITEWLSKQSMGQEKVNYRIRDWLISRQRYWGAPIPMIHCPKDGIVPVPEDQLPVVLPELKNFEPSGDGRSPLANVPEFLNTTCPTCGGPAERETDTMDGFACSSWYFLRFADPHNSAKPFDADKVKHWLPVDDYIGGAEHAVMHLLYARMWTKVMQDEGLIDFGEPFKKLRNQGMILAPDGQKMSKSKGNTIQPDELIEQGYGADSIRIMELFIGPWNQSANWSVEGMGGSYRFLQRIWTLVDELVEKGGTDTVTDKAVKPLKRTIHKAIRKVSTDLEAMSFNTAIAAMMECVNELYGMKRELPFQEAQLEWHWALGKLVQLLAPFAPHIAEEMWHELGNQGSVHQSEWPVYDKEYLVEDSITIAVQVNGKLRGTVALPADSDEAAITAAAKADAKIAGNLDGKDIVKVIYVPGKLLNFVVR